MTAYMTLGAERTGAIAEAAMRIIVARSLRDACIVCVIELRARCAKRIRKWAFSHQIHGT
jgi:hypothetical protein